VLFVILLIGGLACIGLAFLIDRDWWTVLDEDWQPEPEGNAGLVVGSIGVVALGGAMLEAGTWFL
jgi:hypothetical protein